MATKKFYLTNTTSTLPVNPLARWNDPTSTGVSAMSEAPAGSSVVVSKSESANAPAYHVLLRRFVTPAIVRAGALSSEGTVADLVMATRASAANSLRTSWAIWVLAPDGTSRGTLFAGSGDDPWPTTSAGFTQTAPASLSNAVACLPGDRVVLELGFDSRTATATQHTGFIRHGGTASEDLAHGDTGSQIQTRSPHITFTGPNVSDLWTVEQVEPGRFLLTY